MEKEENRFKKALEDHDGEANLSLCGGPHMNRSSMRAGDQWFSDHKLRVG